MAQDQHQAKEDPLSYKETNLWKTLDGASQQAGDQASILLASYERSRMTAALMAGEVARDAPNLTQHDISHIDALWEYADLICGDDYKLTPAEIYVLGISFLVHDLANGSAAIPGGQASIMSGPEWQDTLMSVYQEAMGVTLVDSKSVSAEIRSKALGQYLRDHHAEIAARIPMEAYGSQEGKQRYLIDDSELRASYGYTAGRIAASHWWPAKDLRKEFPTSIGPRAGMPEGWSVDPLILACILRCADACHIDSRRAPEFLRIIRDIEEESKAHWIFQEKLQKPQIKDGRLTYTSSRPFTRDEAAAWWLCREALLMINNELTTVDGILADLQKPRLEGKAVAGVTDVSALAELIGTQDWFPIDAQIRASDVVSIVRRLGGAELYGDNPRVALRELISNSADAVRAKRHLMSIKGIPEWEIAGDITVSVTTRGSDSWLVIRDTGIGMTKEVMAGPLLNFGSSYWSTSSCRRDFPGLLASGFQPTGKYGLGFFSAFMLGKSVTVISRRYDSAAEATMVLEFSQGVEGRPILRRADLGEQLFVGGTEVRVKLDASARKLHKMSLRGHRSREYTLAEICA